MSKKAKCELCGKKSKDWDCAEIEVLCKECMNAFHKWWVSYKTKKIREAMR